MLWVHSHWKYFYSYSVGIGRQILMTKVDPRAVRVKAGIANTISSFPQKKKKILTTQKFPVKFFF